jgi:hypothetical protein
VDDAPFSPVTFADIRLLAWHIGTAASLAVAGPLVAALMALESNMTSNTRRRDCDRV